MKRRCATRSLRVAEPEVFLSHRSQQHAQRCTGCERAPHGRTPWSPAFELRAGQPVELFFVVEHAGCRTVGACAWLRQPNVLIAQARRMLKDERSRGLALDFAGNWLDFRRFEEHNAVDRQRFPAFTNELRQAMFLEPVKLLEHVIRNGHWCWICSTPTTRL